jgi:hypothetical protein
MKPSAWITMVMAGALLASEFESRPYNLVHVEPDVRIPGGSINVSSVAASGNVQSVTASFSIPAEHLAQILSSFDASKR